MTKSAAMVFHEGLAAELRSTKRGSNVPEIKLTCVHPTWAATQMIAPYQAEIAKAGMAILDPQVVADAVVKQILSGRGKQIVLSGGMDILMSFRSWPSWLSGGILAIIGQ